MRLPDLVRVHLLKPPMILGATAAIAMVSIVLTVVYTRPSVAGTYVHPIQGAIMQEVDAAGVVQAADQVDLAFERSGRIVHVSAPVGTHVAAGAVLASIDSADLRASLEQAKAALAAQQAKLDALQAGARPESIAVAQATADAANASYAQSVQNLLGVIQGAYAASDDAVHNKVDQFILSPRTSTPALAFPLSDSQLQASILADRVSMQTTLSSWQTSESALSTTSSDTELLAAASVAQAGLQKVTDFLSETAIGLTEAIPTTSYPSATINGYAAGVALGRANISASTAALNTMLTAVTAARGARDDAQAALTLAKAPATTHDLQAQEAQVASAQATVDAALAQLAKATLRAPFSGTISSNDAHVGQLSSPNVPVISMLSDAQFQFETYVSEADVAKLKAGDGAQITLDTYKGNPLDAHVVAVDPAPTMQGGIAAYKVTLQFDESDPHIKVGLSGDAHITTETKQNVLTVPSTAIMTRGADTYVMRKSASGDTLTPVSIGIESGTGTTEVTAGLTTDDYVRAFTTN